MDVSPVIRSGAKTAQVGKIPQNSVAMLAAFLMVVMLTLVPATPWAASFLERAQQYFEEGKLSSAAIELKNALQRNPDDAEARFLLGKVYLQQGRMISAEKEMQRALQLGHKDPDLDLMLAQVRIKLGRYGEVLENAPEDTAISSDIEKALHVARGQALLNLGRFDEAESIFDRILKEGPHGDALANKAQIAMSLGDKIRARELLNQAIEADSASPLVALTDAVWLLHNREFAKAKDSYARAVELDPHNLFSRLGLVRAHLGLGELNEAAEIVENLKARLPNDPNVLLQDSVVLFFQQQYQSAKVAADRVLARNSRSPQALLISGYSAYQLQENEQARSRLLAYLSQNPHDNRARMVLGSAMIRLGYPDQAYETLTPLDSDVPDDAQYLNVITSAAYGAGDEKAGLKYLEQLATRQPADSQVQSRLGQARLNAGDVAGAQKSFEKAIELDASRLDNYNFLFVILAQQQLFDDALTLAEAMKSQFQESAAGPTSIGIIRLSQRDWASARAAFEDALEREPGNVVAATNLVNLLQLQGEPEAAHSLLMEAIEANPGNPKILLALAALEERQGKIKEAEAQLRQAVEQNPDNLRALTALGRFYLRRNQPDQALALVEEPFQSHPNNPGLTDIVGLAKLALGDRTGALELFEERAKREPSNAAVQQNLMLAYEQSNRIAEALEAADRAIELGSEALLVRLRRVRYLAYLEKGAESSAALASLKEANPDNVEVHLLESDLALAEGRVDDALAAARQAFSLQASTSTLRAVVKSLVADNRSGEAMETMEAWLKDHPQDLAILRLLAGTSISQGDWDKAEVQYKNILKFLPDEVVSLNNLAMIQLRQGAIEDALSNARKAAALAPDNPAIADTFGTVLMQAGQQQEALRQLQIARQGLPENRTVAYHLAQALAATGDVDGAVSTLQEILRSNESFQERADAEALLSTLTQ